MTNRDRLLAELTAQYTRLFQTPSYQVAASHTTPERLAARMLIGLETGEASNTGDGVKAACKALGIKHTYAAIREYLAGGAQ
jgi:hypothetical protein